MIFTSVELVKELMAKTETQTGLRVSVNILSRIYETGRKVSAEVKAKLHVIFDETLPRWHSTLPPVDPGVVI